MPRPAQIDRPQALKTARLLFWRQGYQATPMSQLLVELKMGSGSFYGAFGNKAQLFEQVLDEYANWSASLFRHLGEEHDGLEVIRAFLYQTLVKVSDAERRKGCLLVNSALEMGDVDPHLHACVAARLASFRSLIDDSTQAAATANQLRPGLSPKTASDLVISHIQGLRVESRLGLTRAEATQRVDALIDLISFESGTE